MPIKILLADYNWQLWEVIALIGVAILLAFGFALAEALPEMCKAFFDRYFITSSTAGSDFAEESAPESVLFAGETNSETTETQRPIAEIQRESFSLGETTTCARLIIAGKIGLTDAVKIGTKTPSGEAYQKRSAQIKAMIVQLQPNRFQSLDAQMKPTALNEAKKKQ